MNAIVVDYARILRSKWRWISWAVLIALLALAIALLVQPPLYRSSATVFVRTPGDVSTVLDGGDSYARGRARTYAALGDNPTLAARVIGDLGLNLTPAELSRRIVATNPANTALIEIDVSGPSPAEAQRTATVLLEEFGRLVRDLEAVPGSLVPRAELVTVNPPTAPVRVTPWATPVWAAMLGTLLFGLLLGASAAVVRAIYERRQKISVDVEVPTEDEHGGADG